MFPESQKEEDRLSEENLRLKSAAEEFSIPNKEATVVASAKSLNQTFKKILKYKFYNFYYE